MDTYISSGAYIAMVGGYTSQLLSLDDAGTFGVKLLVVASFTVINLVGLVEVERISSFFSVLIILVFGMAVVFGLVNWQTNPFDPILANPEAPMSCLVDSLSIGIWMYCGYECIAAMSGEYEDSSRNVAKGFRIALPLIALSYVLPTLACLGGLPGRLLDPMGHRRRLLFRRAGLRHDLLDGAWALRRRAVPCYRHYEPVHDL